MKSSSSSLSEVVYLTSQLHHFFSGALPPKKNPGFAPDKSVDPMKTAVNKHWNKKSNESRKTQTLEQGIRDRFK